MSDEAPKKFNLSNLHRHKAKMVAYPDYNKSLTQQRHPNPTTEGITRGAQSGTVGAVLGALVARLMSDNPRTIGAAAAGSGALAAIPGFISGKHQAESDYSKLLYLRRRIGMNDPGELDALLQNPELVESLMPKQAAMRPGTVAKGIGLALGAGGAGYAIGSEGTSRLIGYHDDPAAKHVGGYVNAANFAAVAAALFAAKQGNPKALEALMHPGALAGMAAMEVIPAALRSANRVAGATEQQARGQVSPSISRILESPTAHGAGVGIGLAGLAAIASGLSRAKTEGEIQKRRTRSGMVTRDFLKYLVPAAVGGGVVGSLRAKE